MSGSWGEEKWRVGGISGVGKLWLGSIVCVKYLFSIKKKSDVKI